MISIDRAERSPSHLPDLMPLLDILFILLVFFLLTAGATVAPLPINLVAAQGQASIEQVVEPLLVSLDEAGNYHFHGQRHDSIAELAVPLLAAHRAQGAAVAIAGDQGAPLQALVTLLDWLQGQDIDDVQLIHEQIH